MRHDVPSVPAMWPSLNPCALWFIGGIAKEVFHADQKQMRAKHADSRVPLAPPASAGHKIFDGR
jgi:hypothetical protein